MKYSKLTTWLLPLNKVKIKKHIVNLIVLYILFIIIYNSIDPTRATKILILPFYSVFIYFFTNIFIQFIINFVIRRDFFLPLEKIYKASVVYFFLVLFIYVILYNLAPYLRHSIPYSPIVKNLFYLLIFLLQFFIISKLYSIFYQSDASQTSNKSKSITLFKLFPTIVHLLPSLFLVYFMILFHSAHLLISFIDAKNTQAEFFDNIILRQFWWNSQTKVWKDVFRTNIYEQNYVGSSSLLGSIIPYLKYFINMPFIQTDKNIMYILNTKHLSTYTFTYTGNPLLASGEKIYHEKSIICNLDGIKFLTNLESIGFYDLDIPNYSELKYLHKLRVLYITSCNLQDYNIFNDLNPSIEKLRVNSSRLTDLNGIEKLTNLKYLDCSDNNLKDITPLSKLNNLETLIIYNNPIENWSSLDSLKINVIKTRKDYY